MRIKKSHTHRDIIKSKLQCMLIGVLGRTYYKMALRFLLVIFFLSFFISTWVFRYDIERHVIRPIGYHLGFFGRPEKIVIDIAHADYQRLAYKRKEALTKGVLFSSSEDYVPARIKHNNETYRVKMRLKGDANDHWIDERQWSFRIRLRDDRTIFGMRQFSIQHPRTRNYFTEWFFHELLKYSGLISLRYDFIEVVVNGKPLGLYAIEEHFDKILVENNRYREGPIVRFSDGFYWEYRARGHQQDIDYQEAFWLGPIDVFHPGRTQRNEKLLNQYHAARNLLESFRTGKLTADEVFNVDKLAMFFAVLDLWGNPHAHEYHNVRFYYNPVTFRLEPIGYDTTDMGEPVNIFGSTASNERKRYWATWENRLFEDKDFFRRYIAALKTVSEKQFVDDFFQDIEPSYKKTLNLLYANFPKYTFDRKNLLYKNQDYIKNVLDPVQGIQAYFHSFDRNTGILRLQVGNIQFIPVELSGVFVNGKDVFYYDSPAVLPGKIAGKPVDYRLVEFRKAKGFKWSDSGLEKLKVAYSLLGTDTARTVSVYPWPYIDADLLITDLIRQKPNYENFSFLAIDKENKEISIKPGKWNIDRTLIIPEGFVVTCGESTEFNLTNSAKIISYSPFRFEATEESPIVFTSKDLTGQGVAVINAQKRSFLKNVIFRNMSALRNGSWELTGAVNFYESPVDIIRCQFVGNRESDDSLNIIRSEFTIEKTLFENSSVDAVDIDFSNGTISDSSFLKCGVKNPNSDGIDFSGSVVEVNNVLIEGVGDKALSVGERSRVVANGIKIRGAYIAVASKDMSELTIKDAEISDCKIGLVAYQKKPEFGPAKITVSRLVEHDVGRPYLVEENSKLTIDGSEVEAGPFDRELIR